MKQIFLDILSLDEALKGLISSLDSLKISHTETETVKVGESLGRVTSAPVFARYSSPFFHSSAMDGYAVRFTETFTASETSPVLLKLGQDAVYVDTGDPMPEGFNAVIMVEEINIVRGQKTEDRSQSGDREYIEIYQAVAPYQHVRTIGEDIVATELIIPENHRIRPVDMGAMLASGHIEVAVRRRPKVAIIPTGTEIIEPDIVRERPPQAPEIIEYNSVVLSGLCTELGAEPIRYGIVRDNLEELKERIIDAVRSSDIVLVNAGSGRGSEDYTLTAIKELGEVIINGVSMKPGKPLIAGFVENKPVFGIPGYPVSTYLTFQAFVRPLIARLLGVSSDEKETLSAMISRQISSPMGVDEFVRVKVGVVGNRHVATPVGRGAGLLMSLVRADGIMRVPAGSEGFNAGVEAEIELLRKRSEIRNTVVCIGSHDNALDILATALKKKHPELSLSSAHVGSMGGLMALKRREAHMAGTHLLDEQTGEYNVPYIKRLLHDQGITLINLVYREQGFLVKRGNPKAIRGFEDLIRDEVMFINRQSGSGTRLLLDKHLREIGINPYMIKGYERDEYTHMAVASAVLTGLADTGLAIYSSAQALGLDFIPVAKERYDLAIPSDLLHTEMMQALLSIIREDRDFRTAVESLGGYDTTDMGKVLYEG
ncbi:MAG: molybdopterin biosynthesis protein [Thermodesulfovibrionales bacterium]|jgi:putative molybdopterin biosynthesis protein